MRMLQDEDVQAIVDELESRLKRRFFFNVGKGVTAVVWRWVIYAVIFLAAYGAAKHGVLPWKD